MANKFPKVLLVSRGKEPSGATYLDVHEEGLRDTSFETNTPVAVYALQQLGEVRVTRELVAKDKTRVVRSYQPKRRR
jgi:hypothetical protein